MELLTRKQTPFGASWRFAAVLSLVCLAGPSAAEDAGVLRVMHDLEPVSLNPASPTDSPSARIKMHLFEGLVGYSNTEGYYPALAESWEGSDDARVFRFRLRDDAVWSDGTAISPQSVVESFQFLAGIENGFISDNLSPDEIILGSDDQGDFVEFRLDDPNPNFLAIITDINAMILPMHVADKVDMLATWNYRNLPKALPFSGPYIVSGHSETSISLRPNPDYYAPERIRNGGVDVDWSPGDQDEAAIRRTQLGEVDLSYIRSTGQSEFILDHMPEFFEFIEAPSTEKIWFNHATAPFDNLEIRRAATLALAVDFPDRFVRSNFISMHRSLLPDSMSGSFTPELPSWESEDPVAMLAQAKSIMESLGYSDTNRLAVEFTVNTSTLHERMANLVVARWQQIYMDVTLTVRDWGEYFPETLVAHNFQAARAGWLYDFNHPISLLETFATGNKFNYGLYSNEALDGLVEELRQTFDQAKTDALSRQAMRLIYNDYAVVPLYSRGLAILRQPGLHIGGSTHQGYLYYNDLHYIEASE